MFAIDRGAGIADLERSMRDGHSTAGTPGSGLGAISRLSAWHDVYTQPGKGTAVLARFWQSHVPAPSPLEVEGFSVAMLGEEESGDDWAVREDAEGCSIFVVDGLGHGLAAAEAAREAVRAFRDNGHRSVIEQMDAIHARLRSTRGAAAALARLDSRARTVRFVGIGNIAGIVIDGSESRSMVSMSGTLGHNVRTIREFTYPWRPGALVVMHSDGVSGRWDFSTYPGLKQRAPALAASVIYRDMARGKDDATVVIAREGGAQT